MSARNGNGGVGGSNNRRGNGIEKPWASGRVLTPEQRARKQEADRKANRFLKKEVQDRLSLLESRVEGLEKAKGDNIAIKAPPSSSGDAAATMEWSVPGRSMSRADDHSEQTPSPSVHTNETYFPSSDPALRHSPHAQGTGEGVAQFETPDSAGSQRKTVTPDFTDVASIARTRSEGRHMTCFLNNLVNYIRTIPPAAVCFDDQFNQDLVLTAVLKGWTFTLSRYGQRCPLWDVLRLVDMYLLRDTSLLERVGCLRMLHKRYMFEVNANVPTAGPPPPWYRPQFCEKVFFHDPVIDHLTWPSLRHRLIASEKDRLSNRFWVLYMRNIRVLTGHEPIDIMSYSRQNKLYSLTPDFEAALLNLDNWRMDMEFFKGIPQLAGDVPPHNYMPLKTHMPNFGIQTQEQQQDHDPQSAQNRTQVQSQKAIHTPIHTMNPQMQSQTPVQTPIHAMASHQTPSSFATGSNLGHTQISPPQVTHQQQHPQQAQDMDCQWLSRPAQGFIDDVAPPHLDMSKFNPTGQWHD